MLWQGLVGAGVLAAVPGALRRAPVRLEDLRLVATSAPTPPIVSRSQWGADESLRTGEPEFAPITRAIVHHTVTANDESDPAGRMRAIHEFHVRGQRWSDIGYNFVVDGGGRIYEGRSAGGAGAFGEDASRRGVVGAHAEGHNTGTVGIAVLGTYTSAMPSEAALDAVAAVVAWKLGTRGVDPTAAGTVVGHRDVVATGCPGEGLHRYLPEIRLRAASRIVASRPADSGSGGIVEELLDAVSGLLG